MIITALDTGRDKFFLIFPLLSSEETGGVTAWLRRKISDGRIRITGEINADEDSINEACMRKFGVCAKIIPEKDIPVTHISLDEMADKAAANQLAEAMQMSECNRSTAFLES